MNKLNRFIGQSRLGVRAFALLSVAAALTAGCVGPHRVEQAIASDDPDRWAARINSLPVEVHGTAPGETTEQTIAAIDHGVAGHPGAKFGDSGLSLYAIPRVVVYIGGSTAPARNQYCALAPNVNRSVLVPKDALILRSSLCDGPRAVAYARISISERSPSAEDVARGIVQIKSDLVQSLPLPAPGIPEFD